MICIFLAQDVEPKLHIKKHDWKKTHANMMAAIKEAKFLVSFICTYLEQAFCPPSYVVTHMLQAKKHRPESAMDVPVHIMN